MRSRVLCRPKPSRFPACDRRGRYRHVAGKHPATAEQPTMLELVARHGAFDLEVGARGAGKGVVPLQGREIVGGAGFVGELQERLLGGARRLGLYVRRGDQQDCCGEEEESRCLHSGSGARVSE